MRVVVVVNQGTARVDTITSDQDRASQLVANLNAANPPGLPAAVQTAWVVPLPADVLQLITDLADPDPCWFDHSGGCQAHGWYDGTPCPHARAQRLLAAARTEGLTHA